MTKKLFYHTPLLTKKQLTPELPFKLDFDQTVSCLDNLMDETIASMIRDRNIVKEPVGVLFSGGLDSTLVAFYAIKNSHKEVE